MNANAFQIENAFDAYGIVACFVLFPIIYVIMIWQEKGWLKFYYCIPLAFAVAMALPIFVIGSASIAATKAFWKELMNKLRWIRNEML